MIDPFVLPGPACISFSGGRTSAYMLHRILERAGGELPEDVHVAFANTGKERAETLDFVRACSVHWGVSIRWVEYVRGSTPEEREEGEHAEQFREVNYASASRAGEPFAALIEHRQCLPGPRLRFCTEVLKIRAMRWLMRDVLSYPHWIRAVGIRADEPDRVARMRTPGRDRERWETVLPLADAGVTEAAVMHFWAQQPFDLQLRPYEGNCDLCFLKSHAKRVRILQEHPETAAWWIAQEHRGDVFQQARPRERVSARFRPAGPDYAALAGFAGKQLHLPLLPTEDPTDLGDCLCHD